jgi:hypothetical protein
MLIINDDIIKGKLNEIKAEFSDIKTLFKIAGSQRNIYEPFNVVPEMWEAYFKYLVELQKGLREMKNLNLTLNEKIVCLRKIIRISMHKANENLDKKFKLKKLMGAYGVY